MARGGASRTALPRRARSELGVERREYRRRWSYGFRGRGSLMRATDAALRSNIAAVMALCDRPGCVSYLTFGVDDIGRLVAYCEKCRTISPPPKCVAPPSYRTSVLAIDEEEPVRYCEMCHNKPLPLVSSRSRFRHRYCAGCRVIARRKNNELCRLRRVANLPPRLCGMCQVVPLPRIHNGQRTYCDSCKRQAKLAADARKRERYHERRQRAA